jgi:hypothetical protein
MTGWLAARLPSRGVTAHLVHVLGEDRPLGVTNYQEGEVTSTAEAGLTVASAGCGAGEAGGKALKKKRVYPTCRKIPKDIIASYYM